MIGTSSRLLLYRQLDMSEMTVDNPVLLQISRTHNSEIICARPMEHPRFAACSTSDLEVPCYTGEIRRVSSGDVDAGSTVQQIYRQPLGVEELGQISLSY